MSLQSFLSRKFPATPLLPRWGNVPDWTREPSYLETPTAYPVRRLSRCMGDARLRRRDRINGMPSTRLLNQAGGAIGLTLFLLLGCNAIVGLDKLEVTDHPAGSAGSSDGNGGQLNTSGGSAGKGVGVQNEAGTGA